jgi:hypothetical protein
MLNIFKKETVGASQFVPQGEDMRFTKDALFVHPERSGVLLMHYYDNAWIGKALYQGEAFESSLENLIEQGWICLPKREFQA